MITIHSVENPSVSYNEKGKHGQTYSFVVDLERQGETSWKGIVVTCKFLDGDFVEHLHSSRSTTLEESKAFGTSMPIDVKLTEDDIQCIQVYYEEIYPDHDYYRQLGKREQLPSMRVTRNVVNLGERPAVEGKIPYEVIINGKTTRVLFESEPDLSLPIMAVADSNLKPQPFSIDRIDRENRIIHLKEYELPKFNYCLIAR